MNHNSHRTNTTSPWKGRPTADNTSTSPGGRNNGGVASTTTSNQNHHHLTVHQAVSCAMRAHLDTVSSAIPVVSQPSLNEEGAEGTTTKTPSSATPSTPADGKTSTTATRSHQHGPFVLMCGKTFSAASGIAFHNTETLHQVQIQQADDSDRGEAPPPSPSQGLSIYKIGTHYNLYPALFCTCPSFQFQCINKPEALLCKHLLAVALRLGHHHHHHDANPTSTSTSGSIGGGVTNPTTASTIAIPTLALPQDEFIEILGAFAVSERGGPFRGGAR